MLFLTKTRRKPQQLLILWLGCAMRMWRGGVENTTLPTKLVGGDPVGPYPAGSPSYRSEEHTSELQSLMRISYAVFCLKTKNKKIHRHSNTQPNAPITITITTQSNITSTNITH